MIEFHSSPNPTIGVEIEFQIIDDKTFGLNNTTPKILAEVNKKFSNKIRAELIESMIEINTSICNTVEDVEKDIKETLIYLEEILKQGTGATIQRKLYKSSGKFEYMIQSIKEQFYQ